MEKLNMHTPDLVDENIKKLGELFPDCVTERKDSEGKVELAIDFDKLKQELSKNVVDGDTERYQFTWPGKMEARLIGNAPINKSLRPIRNLSVNFDSTENLYIEGDNLDALKLLHEEYLGRIKMIYIDPPYNTGKDFIYEDNRIQNVNDYLSASNQFDESGNQLSSNPETSGRYHTDWLNFMYPRLKIAKDYLSEDGVIFISINDYEVGNLMKLCEEIFGYRNKLGCFCWRTDGNFDNQARIKTCHEYILVYAKNEQNIGLPHAIDPNIPKDSKIFKTEIRNTIIKNGIKNPISGVKIPVGFPSDVKNFVIKSKDVIWPKYNADIHIENFKVANEVIATTGWASKAQLVEFINNGFKPVIDTKGQETTFVMTKTGAIEAIKVRGEVSHVISVLNNMGGTQKATADMGELGKYFDYPKPLSLMKYLCKMYTDSNDIILDFFSGSATTAHAVMELNEEDCGNRKFIMIQLPEKTKADSLAFKDGFKNICEIGEARIKWAGKKIQNKKESQGKDLFKPSSHTTDIGFRVLKVDSSNMNDVFYHPKDYKQDLFGSLENNIKADRTPEDLLFQVMLETDIPLSAKIEQEMIHGKNFFKVADGVMYASFDKDLTEEAIIEVAKRKPMYFVMRNSSAATDSVITNFDTIFKTYSIDTVRKIL